ncbi:MAG: DegQ family serine endoprotease [Alphaproteobacteria bacterium]|nr:DegQ family serine endoprotease [Alphaproteobacteria bacterium]
MGGSALKRAARLLRPAWLALPALGALAGVFAAPAIAEEARPPASAAEISLSFAPTVKKTAPAVVNVYARRTVVARFRSPFADDPFFGRFLGDRGFGMPRERVQNSLGSGVIVRADGIIVTNNHVIENGEAFKVVLADRREFDAELVLADARTDLAVLRIDPGTEALPALDFADSDRLEVGDLVLAIGNPFGVGQTVTSGIVSALARTQVGVADYRSFIQTDAAINPGNSGGALVNAAGELIGINTAIYSRSGGSNGIGFAIPANMVQLVVTSALTEGRVVRPWFGAETQGVDAALAAALDLPRPSGVLVTAVAEKGPAARAGLRKNDLVTEVAGFEVSDPDALRYRLAVQPLGAPVEIKWLREGKVKTARLSVEAPPEDPPREETQLEGSNPLSGATIANLSPALADELGLPVSARGVIVLRIATPSLAARSLRPGDILRSVNGKEIGTVADAKAAIAGDPAYWDLVLVRGGNTMRLTGRL